MKEPLFHLKYTNSGANNDRSFVPPGIDDRRYGYLSPTDMAVKKKEWSGRLNASAGTHLADFVRGFPIPTPPLRPIVAICAQSKTAIWCLHRHHGWKGAPAPERPWHKP
jgi:hypothetical protein